MTALFGFGVVISEYTVSYHLWQHEPSRAPAEVKMPLDPSPKPSLTHSISHSQERSSPPGFPQTATQLIVHNHLRPPTDTGEQLWQKYLRTPSRSLRPPNCTRPSFMCHCKRLSSLCQVTRTFPSLRSNSKLCSPTLKSGVMSLR